MQKIRVLIAEDYGPCRTEIRNLLELDGIEVVGEATNGLEAVEMTRALKPEVVLMDNNMPSLTGVDATRNIKKELPNVSVIFLAAEETWREDAIAAGAEAYLLKDKDWDVFVEAVKAVAGRKMVVSPRVAKPASRLSGLRERLMTWPVIVGASVLAVLALALVFRTGTFAFVGLAFGLFFFGYAMKYYASVALILGSNGNGNGNGNGHNGHNGHNGGLQLKRKPFVSIHLPMYNEERVVDRLLTACTSLDYDNYEIVVADDSTDNTVEMLKRWEKHPKIKISHRRDRRGFKGGALQAALQRTDPRAEFIVVFDADFVPAPDTIQQFLAYFYGSDGESYVDDRVAVVQGYQWHMLNASENWITKGIRVEFSGSYVIERPGQQLLGGVRMVAGSVFMIRADVLRKHGWSTSITEDWELTIRLYLDGYKVIYTPFIQTPAECVSGFQQLIRQRMRWAEGHTHNVRKYLARIVASGNISLREKVEFLYYAPYYLQSIFFVAGTVSWLISELIFHRYIPYWTALLGWALVFSNLFSLVLMNVAGLFLERGVKRNWSGVFSFVLLSNLLVPFQAYAALKGLLEEEEGGWNRTLKSGNITEALGRLRLGRRLKQLLPEKNPRKAPLAPAVVKAKGERSLLRVPRLMPMSKRRPRLATTLIMMGAALLMSLSTLAFFVPTAMGEAGAPYAQPGLGGTVDFTVSNCSTCTFWFYNQTSPLTYMMYQTQPNGTAGSSKGGWLSFFSDTFDAVQEIQGGTATVYMYAENGAGAIHDIKTNLYVNRGGSRVATLFTGSIDVPARQPIRLYSASFSYSGFDLLAGDRLEMEFGPEGAVTIYWDGQYNASRLEVGVIVPENALVLLVPAALIPLFFGWRRGTIRLAALRVGRGR